MIPTALARKYPNAEQEWAWQWVFPATSHYTDPHGVRRRHHLHESVVQKAVKAAARAADVGKRVTCHTFRHSFATHLLQDVAGLMIMLLALGLALFLPDPNPRAAVQYCSTPSGGVAYRYCLETFPPDCITPGVIQVTAAPGVNIRDVVRDHGGREADVKRGVSGPLDEDDRRVGLDRAYVIKVPRVPSCAKPVTIGSTAG